MHADIFFVPLFFMLFFNLLYKRLCLWVVALVQGFKYLFVGRECYRARGFGINSDKCTPSNYCKTSLT